MVAWRSRRSPEHAPVDRSCGWELTVLVVKWADDADRDGDYELTGKSRGPERVEEISLGSETQVECIDAPNG